MPVPGSCCRSFPRLKSDDRQRGDAAGPHRGPSSKHHRVRGPVHGRSASSRGLFRHFPRWYHAGETGLLETDLRPH